MTSTGPLDGNALGKFRRRLAILGLAASFLIAVVVGSSYLTDIVVQAIYRNVAEPLDEELPVTVTSFRPAPHIVSTIGGMGAGLGCSLPRFIDFVFERPWATKQRIPVRQRFRQACVFHDLCYRHGLATYGYTQSDCDELLQEQALRICISTSSPTKTLTDCQIDAKKAAAGVKIFGATQFQSWDKSTFFEFDPNPYRSTRFFASRAIDDPLKKEFPGQHSSDPDQLLMMFRVQRGGVQRACLNCEDREISGEEFALANVSDVNIDRKMREEEPVWIPTGRFYPAPHVMVDGRGQPVFAWLARQQLDYSESCFVLADPIMLLTGTQPKWAGCSKNANPRLGLTQIDVLSSSPQLSTIPLSQPLGPHALSGVVATGLTAQQGKLKICVSGDLRGSQNTEKLCHTIKESAGKTIDRPVLWGAFQNFPIIRGERHIYLLRTMIAEGDDNVRTVHPIAFDISQQQLPGNTGTLEIRSIDLKKFDLRDDYDPQVPVTMQSTDMRLMSIERHGGTLKLYEIDLGSPQPKLEPMILLSAGDHGSGDVRLHESWARRPMLVVETGSPETERRTQLILSRSKVTTPEEQPKQGALDSAQLEFAVLERPAAPVGDRAPFKLVSGLTCSVTYTVKKTHRIKPCQRAAVPPNQGRLTPATRLQGAQLLVGRFARGNSAPMLAVFDRCFFLPPVPAPIIVQPTDIGHASGPIKLRPATSSILERQGECRPLRNSQRLAEQM